MEYYSERWWVELGVGRAWGGSSLGWVELGVELGGSRPGRSGRVAGRNGGVSRRCDSTASPGIRKSRLPVTAPRRNRSRYPQTPASFYGASYCVADPSNGSPSARSSPHRRRTLNFVSPVPKSTGETPRTFARAGEDVRRASIVTGPIKFEILSASAASYHRSSPD